MTIIELLRINLPSGSESVIHNLVQVAQGRPRLQIVSVLMLFFTSSGVTASPTLPAVSIASTFTRNWYGTFVGIDHTYRPLLPMRSSVIGVHGPAAFSANDSVIGVQKEQVLQRFLTGLPGRFEAAKGDPRFCAVLIGCDENTGRARSIDRLMFGE